MTTVLVNGEAHGSIDPTDRGFTLGDGVFETIAVEHGVARRWRMHMQRLALACAHLSLSPPEPGCLEAEIGRLLAPDDHGRLRLTLTRGPGPPGYGMPANPCPTRVVAFTPGSGRAAAVEPARVRTCRLRLARQPALAGLKHLNRLEQVLARAEWQGTAYDEGLLYDGAGHLVEATASNVFLVRNAALSSPRLRHCGVSGVMRSAVIAAAEHLGIDVSLADLGSDDVHAADEVFLTNATMGIRAVAAIDDVALPPAPGPVTRRLCQAVEGIEDAPYLET